MAQDSTRRYTDQVLRQVLTDNRRVAVVGLSPNEMRPSYFAAKYLRDHGFTIFPVNPGCAEVLGRRCYPDLRSIPEPIDVVDVFQRPDRVLAVAQQAIEIGARVLWLQLGIINDQAAALAGAAGLTVIMDRCMKIEYARLFGGINLVGVNTRIISSRRPLAVVR